MSETVLVVDDEIDVVRLVRANLERANFLVRTARDGSQALESARTLHPDIIILDVMLPSMDGYEVCRQLKSGAGTAHIPVLMLSAKGDQHERVAGFEFGADDYVSKPFSPKELVYRVKALTRRVIKVRGANVLTGIHVDAQAMSVSLDGRKLELTITEFKLLTLFMERKEQILSRKTLLEEVLDYHKAVDTRTIDTHVRRLREKLGQHASLIKTVRGYGYRFSLNILKARVNQHSGRTH